MKYIRTKDNAIYKIENNKLIVGNMKVNCKDLQALKQEGYKIANTIEELCDEFVIVNEYKELAIDLEMAKINNKNGNIIYGAIWTNKGLIYVAKMNEKGELVLI